MKLLFALLIATVVLGVGAYQRYDKHSKRVLNLKHSFAINERFYHAFNDLDLALRPDIDAYNHAINAMFSGLDNFTNAGAIESELVRVKHLQYEHAKIDRDVVRFQATVRTMHKEKGTPEKRDVSGAFETYFRSSDELRDSMITLSGWLKAAQANPLNGIGDDTAFGTRLSRSFANQRHAFQTLINIQANTTQYFAEQRGLIDREAVKVSQQPFWAT